MGGIMSWIEKLYQTYDNCAGQPQFESFALMPISHTTQQAQIEIMLNRAGQFVSARALPKAEAETLIPCTEASGGKTGTKPENHPLCDKLQYVAGDFEDYGGELTSGFAKDLKKDPNAVHPYRKFLEELDAWRVSLHTHPKVSAIHTYVSQGSVIKDLLRVGVLLPDGENRFLKEWKEAKKKAPGLYQLNVAPEDAFVRWKVGDPGDTLVSTWEDHALINAWINYYQVWKEQDRPPQMCMVTGNLAPIALMHPTKLRSSGDKAKLISSNDNDGFTFRGRFADPDKPKHGSNASKEPSAAEQACTVSYEVSQKSHLALRWLLAYGRKQSFHNGSQAYVAWDYGGAETPKPFVNSLELLAGIHEDREEPSGYLGDAGQAFGRRLSKQMRGYAQKLSSSKGISIIGIDSATGNQGRAAIIYYRELTGSEFIERIEAWHKVFAWPQRYERDRKVVEFVGAPAPNEIAEAAFGGLDKDKDRKLLRATIERLIPCIIDGRSLPLDLVEGAVRRTCNRTGFEKTKGKKGSVFENAWEMQLGIACALYKGSNTQHTHQMALEEDRTTRSYLYGRLLAIAEFIEGRALHQAGEKRDTNAARYMSRFSIRPYSTWTHIEQSLTPYMNRLETNSRGLATRMKTKLDDVHHLFEGDAYRQDEKLDGEFLLAFHCQRKRLWEQEEEIRKEWQEKNRKKNEEQTTT